MGIFDSDWQRLHKKISRQYELIAIRNFETGISPGRADVLGIITEIVKEYVPSLNEGEAAHFVKNEYKLFKEFSLRNEIESALKERNPDIPEIGISEIFESVKKCFLNPKYEHTHFLHFIISKIFELQNFSISRGYYMLEISRGRIPRPSRFVSFFHDVSIMARHSYAERNYYKK